MLITDRSYADCERAAEILRKVQNGMQLTAEEKAEYNQGLKGCYNASDLNRIESSMHQLAPLAGLTITTKTNWTYADILLADDIKRILSNANSIKNALVLNDYDLPTADAWIDYNGANRIEKLLEKADAILNPPTEQYSWDVYTVIIDQKIIDKPGSSTLPQYVKPPNRICYTGAIIKGGKIELSEVLNNGAAMNAYDQSDALKKANQQGKKLYYSEKNVPWRYQSISIQTIVSSYLAYVQVIDTQKSKGKYINTVSSTDPNAYPADGVQGDLWYTKKP